MEICTLLNLVDLQSHCTFINAPCPVKVNSSHYDYRSIKPLPYLAYFNAPLALETPLLSNTFKRVSIQAVK